MKSLFEMISGGKKAQDTIPQKGGVASATTIEGVDSVSQVVKKRKAKVGKDNEVIATAVPISEPVKATPAPQRKIVDQKKLSTFGLSKDRDQFVENLSMLVLSGMSITEALNSIIKQTKSAGMKAIL